MSSRHVLLLFFLVTFFGQTVQADDPVHMWSKRFGEIGGANQVVTDVALDASDNIVFAGYFEGVVDFGGGPLVSAGESDIFVAKFDRFGSHVWSGRFGDTMEQPSGGLDVTVDSDGNVILAGAFEGAVDFDGGRLESGGGSDVFIAKFDPVGSHLWSACFGDSVHQYGTAVACDSSGNSYLVGDFTGTLNFGGDTFTSESGWDWFDVKFDPQGNHVWSHASSGSDLNKLYAKDVAIDSNGGVVIVGIARWWAGSLGLGLGQMIVRRLFPNGTHDESFFYGEEFLMFDEEKDEAHAVATGALGSFVLTGIYADTNVFFGKWDNSCDLVWSHTYGSWGTIANGIAIDSTGNMVIVGNLGIDGVNFGGGYLPEPGTFAVKIDSSGNHLWSEVFSGHYLNGCWDVAVNASGDFVIGGGFSNSIDFGGGPLVSAGGQDAFLAKFASSPTGIEKDPARRSLGLAARPNPFNMSTTISFTMSERARVTLTIYDVQGKMVRTLVSDDDIGEGYQERTWDGRDDRNNPVSSGVYFYKIMCGNYMLTKKLVLLN